jgi:TRAP-type C4-dicarboxylate transport system substrate-binding protein
MSKKLKSESVLFLVLVLVITLFVVGCAKEKAAATGEALKMEQQKWSLMITRGNLNSFDDAEQQRAFDRIKERTDGLLDIQTVFSGSLPIKPEEWLRAVAKGDLEGCMVVGDYHAGDMPILGLIQTPFLFRDQVEKNSAIIATWPIMQREANKLGVQLLACRPYAEVGFWTTDPVDNITDVNGRKMRAQAKVYADMIEAINGVPVPVAWGETYTALQRGLVKGIFTGYDSFTSAKLYEVAPYAHRIFLSNQFPYIGVNKELWDKLPDDVKYIVMDELSRSMVTIQANVPRLIDGEIEKQRAGGLKSYNPNPPAEWFELMAEKVAKPTLQEELDKCGDVGQELVAIIESALGRQVR